MSDSARPHRRQPTRLPRPWDSPGKNTGVGCHFLLQCRKVKSESEVAQSYLTLSDPMDCSPPGSSVHGIFQARVLEWVAIAFFWWEVNMVAPGERMCCEQCSKLKASGCSTYGVHPGVYAAPHSAELPVGDWAQWATRTQPLLPVQDFFAQGLLMDLAKTFPVLHCNLRLCSPIPTSLHTSFIGVSPAEIFSFVLLLLLPCVCVSRLVVFNSLQPHGP